MIDAGLPPDSAGWPEEVLEALRQFRQGDIIDAPPFFYFADPTAPVWAATAEARLTQPDVVLVEGVVPYAVLTTQTCDIGEEDSEVPRRPFVQIAPVYDATGLVDASMCKLLAKGRGSMYLLHVPLLPEGFWVADLRLEVPIEKGWLARRVRIPGFGDERARHALGERVVRIRERPALAKRFIRVCLLSDDTPVALAV